MRRKDDPEPEGHGLDELELDESQIDEIKKLLSRSPKEIKLMIDILQWLLQLPLEEIERSREPSKPWEPWMDSFLEDLERNGGNASLAIELSGRCRQTVYKRRHQTPEFGLRWRQICND